MKTVVLEIMAFKIHAIMEGNKDVCRVCREFLAVTAAIVPARDPITITAAEK